MDNPHTLAICKDMHTDTDIAVVGSGLNGLTLALALGRAGFRTTLIDALPRQTWQDPGFDGRSYAMALTSVRMLEGIGVWDDLAETAQPMLQIKVSDGRAGSGPSPFMMHFDHAEIEEGPMGYMVEDRHLRPTLDRAVDKVAQIRRLDEMKVKDQMPNSGGITLSLSSGDTLKARLVIGADGRETGTGSRAGIRHTRWRYGQTALVCAIGHDLPHDGIAHQYFMPPGPLAILPLRGNRSSIVWSETSENAAAINALPNDAYLQVLRPRFGSFLGDIRLEGARFSYPLGLSLAHEMVAPRVALVGDAAHGVHPIAGQGLNAGMRDIAALADVTIDAQRRGEDIGSEAVLARYQDWRRFDNTTLALATDSFNRLFSNDNPLLRAARDIGMAAVNALPGLRRGFIREAAGLTGELPRLMRGMPL